MKKFNRVDRADIRQVITDSIIAKIEAGGVLPWKCPWVKGGDLPMPYNWLTKQSYSGINILILWDRAEKHCYSMNAWLTFKQAEQLGGNVRKGEKAVQCVFYKPIEVDDDKAGSGVDGAGKKFIPCLKTFSLFNIEQVEGLDNLPIPSVMPESNAADADVDVIDRFSEIYCRNTGVEIRRGGDSAYYSPTLDIIRMPTTFLSGSGYAATLAHELAHSTGHRKRLNRFDQQAEAMKGFKIAYAFEELVAELSSCFTCAELGIQGEYEQHVSYLDSWLKVLKGDKTFIFKAAAAASKAHAFLMNGGIEVVRDVTNVA